MANRYIKTLTSSLLFKHAHVPPKEDLPIVMYNDFIGKVIILRGFYEKKLIELILNSLDFNTTERRCLDIGANIGNHTLQFKKFFKHVRSYEPQQRTFKVLSLNTSHLDNVEIFNFGLSDKNADVVFKIPRHNAGGASQYFSGQNYYEENVKLKKYDELYDDEISYVKIDVEGNEIAALEGMSENIMKYKPVISFEYNLGDKEGLVKLLKSYGYTTFLVPRGHAIDSYIKSNRRLYLYTKLLVRALTPPVKNELVEVDLEKANKSYGLVSTCHPDSKFKISPGN